MQQPNDPTGGSPEGQDLVVPLLEEEAHVEAREVVSGKVRVETRVESFDDIASAVLHGEEVEVTRVAIDRVVTEAPSLRTEGDVTIVPILEEVLFVEKRLVLKEELHIRRVATREEVHVPVTLRRQTATVERTAGDEQNGDDAASLSPGSTNTIKRGDQP
ncbi:conserved domain-containing protein [Faunimonas pinastri]|uniref:Conserved domain-containing protein n=1 Tax=Faunimonas pinastri TaxID=1855383 RepID=A0A1H9NKA8_9HYPH|nr:YsnF/AvaK domain-containing protein [Faunimonas pinastri]SER36332.1 conserved domain-containing protein [Faunimonas pinastri]